MSKEQNPSIVRSYLPTAAKPAPSQWSQKDLSSTMLHWLAGEPSEETPPDLLTRASEETTGPSFSHDRSGSTGRDRLDFDPNSCTTYVGLSMLGDAVKALQLHLHEDLHRFEFAREAYDEAIGGLLKARDFLGLQLDHAWGNIGDDEFEERALPFLNDQDKPMTRELAKKIRILCQVSGVQLDVDALSAAFGCQPDALDDLATERIN